MNAFSRRNAALRLVDESGLEDDEPVAASAPPSSERVGGVPESSPNSRWVLTGPFARIHDRAELLEDLGYAVRPRTTQTVLALFGFKGLRQRLESALEPDDNKLLAAIAGALVDSVGPNAVLYEPRRGDFCGLFDGRLELVEPMLVEIVAAIDAETAPLGIETAAGVVSLPAEAHTPVGALDLADRRRRELAGDLRPTPRLSVYQRITAALRPPTYLSDVTS